MSPDEMDDLLASMLDDHRLSRGERRALRELVVSAGLDDRRLAVFRSRAFEMARAQVDAEGQVVIDWLEGAIKSLLPRPAENAATAAARFSPGHECLQAIIGELKRATRTIDACVFTITDDRIVDEILAADRRGVRVRVVTDDDKSLDLGSDVDRMSRAGIDVRMDATPDHMHHKFAIFDHERLVTGSYNWTRSAAEHNHENLVVTDDTALVVAFERTFERLWERFSPALRRG